MRLERSPRYDRSMPPDHIASSFRYKLPCCLIEGALAHFLAIELNVFTDFFPSLFCPIRFSIKVYVRGHNQSFKFNTRHSLHPFVSKAISSPSCNYLKALIYKRRRNKYRYVTGVLLWRRVSIKGAVLTLFIHQLMS